jgi:heme exporter protein D
MTPLGPHADFIIVAYVAAIVVVAGLIVWIWLDYQAQRRVLDELEKRGVKRRSRRKA